jgi:hypothetical protein
MYSPLLPPYSALGSARRNGIGKRRAGEDERRKASGNSSVPRCARILLPEDLCAHEPSPPSDEGEDEDEVGGGWRSGSGDGSAHGGGNEKQIVGTRSLETVSTGPGSGCELAETKRQLSKPRGGGTRRKKRRRMRKRCLGRGGCLQ